MKVQITDAHKAASENNLVAAIDYAWEDSKSTEVDWLGFEAAIRCYVRQTQNLRVDEIVAAFTKRGRELK